MTPPLNISPPNFMMIFRSPESPQCCVHVCACKAFHWNMGGIRRCMKKKKKPILPLPSAIIGLQL